MMCFPRELSQSYFKTMYLDSFRLLLAFKSTMVVEEISSLLTDLNLVMEELPDDPLPALDGQIKKINNTPNRLWVRSCNGIPISSGIIAAMEERFMEFLSWIGPVYRMEGLIDQEGFVCPLPNEIFINPFKRLSRNKYTMLLTMIEKYEMKNLTRKSLKFSGYHCYGISNPRQNPSYVIKTIFEHLADVLFNIMPMIQTHSIIQKKPTAIQENCDNERAVCIYR
jgi:hypothetical protein